jgi:hypothetical protein
MRMDAAKDCTPVEITSEAFIANYGFRWRQVYMPFFAEWNIPYTMPQAVSVPESLDLLTQINAGKKRLDWCPREVNIMHHLYPFFASRGILFDCPDLSEKALMDLRSEADSWIVTSAERCYATEQEHHDHVKQSGFYRQILAVPNLVQILYLLALAEYRGTGFAKNNIPFASESMDKLMFARASTGLCLADQSESRLAVAYLPAKAVVVRAMNQNGGINICSIGSFILR